MSFRPTPLFPANAIAWVTMVLFVISPSGAEERPITARTGNSEVNPSATSERQVGLPQSRRDLQLEGWQIQVDDRLFTPEHEELRLRALRFLENKLVDIRTVVPADRVERLQSVRVVLDLNHGKLESMQYHPSAEWLAANGFARELAHCVHLPRAADLVTPRNIREQPWVILHELAHAYHDQVLGFDDQRIRAAFEKYRASGHGEHILLHNGNRTRHYALTDHKEFFAEMSEAYFGVNDFYPFNRAELHEAEPEIYYLIQEVWESPLGTPASASDLPE